MEASLAESRGLPTYLVKRRQTKHLIYPSPRTFQIVLGLDQDVTATLLSPEKRASFGGLGNLLVPYFRRRLRDHPCYDSLRDIIGTLVAQTLPTFKKVDAKSADSVRTKISECLVGKFMEYYERVVCKDFERVIKMNVRVFRNKVKGKLSFREQVLVDNISKNTKSCDKMCEPFVLAHQTSG